MPNVSTLTAAVSVLDWLADDAAWLDSALSEGEESDELDPQREAVWEETSEGQAALRQTNERIVESLKQPRATRQAEWMDG